MKVGVFDRMDGASGGPVKRKQWVWLCVASVISLGLLAGGAVLLWRPLSDTDTAAAATALAGVIATLAGLLTGAAGAVAAVAAFRAARESRLTALHAAEALGLAIEPELQRQPLVRYVDGTRPDGGRWVATVTNDSRWGATDVVLDVEMADGRRATHRTETLPPRPDPDPRVPFKPSQVIWDLGDPRPMPWDAPDWRGQTEFDDRYVLSYSDERGLIRWRVRYTVHHTAGADGEIATRGQGAIIVKERVQP